MVINSFDYGRYLGCAIDSALAKRWPDTEVVVVDDGSTDCSRAVIAGYRDRIVTVLKENGGQASALNAGFAASSGEVVLLLDADDWFLPSKVPAVMAALGADPSLGWCFHPLAYSNGGSSPRGVPGRVDARAAMRRGRHHGVVAPATSGLAFTRALLEQILPMPESLRVPLPGGGRGTAADAFVKVAAIGLAPGVVLDAELAVQRLHEANAYTARPQGDPRRAALELQVADELRSRWPHLRRYSLAKGLGGMRRLRGDGVDDGAASAAVDVFVAGCTGAERARLVAHRAVWAARR